MKLLKEPLLHFLLLSGLIFLGYYIINRNTQSKDAIVINQEEYDHLVNLWKLQWKREPDKVDAQAILDRYIRQEVFYREALALNLDQNDEIIKRRLSQKMEAVSNDLNKLMNPPTEEELKAFYEQHPEWFGHSDSYAFKQVLFSKEEKNAMQDLLPALQQGIVPADRKGKMSLANEWPLTDSLTLVNAFGSDFSLALKDLPEGEWAGPVPSGFGWHWVYVQEKRAAGMLPFGLVKEEVAREYEYRTELESQDKAFKELLEKYSIEVNAKLPDGLAPTYSKMSQQ